MIDVINVAVYTISRPSKHADPSSLGPQRARASLMWLSMSSPNLEPGRFRSSRHFEALRSGLLSEQVARTEVAIATRLHDLVAQRAWLDIWPKLNGTAFPGTRSAQDEDDARAEERPHIFPDLI